MTAQGRIRVVIGKPGLDGHERGAWTVAYGLRDAGFEVIYLGLRQTPEHLAKAAIDEDADVLGLSILSGAHLSLTRRVLDAFARLGQEHPLVLVGGAIPDRDVPALAAMGVNGVFPAGSTIPQIANFIKDHVAADAADSVTVGDGNVRTAG